jgi:hypothetical protein
MILNGQIHQKMKSKSLMKRYKNKDKNKENKTEKIVSFVDKYIQISKMKNKNLVTHILDL